MRRELPNHAVMIIQSDSGKQRPGSTHPSVPVGLILALLQAERHSVIVRLLPTDPGSLTKGNTECYIKSE